MVASTCLGGAEVNARDDLGYTAPISTSQRGQMLKVRTLLDHGADIDAQDQAGDTALVSASKVWSF